MPKSKYIGMIFEGRWEVVERIKTTQDHGNFKLRNIYNNEELIICDNVMQHLAEGKTDICYIIQHRMKAQKYERYKRTYPRQKLKNC